MIKVLIATVVVLTLLGVGVWYYFFADSGSPNIGLEIVRPEEVRVGEQFPVSINLSNSSDKILEDASISLALPSGIVVAGENEDSRVIEKVIGDVGPGSVTKETFTLVALRGAQSVTSLEAAVKYKFRGNATARYESKTKSEFRLGNRAISVGFTLPQKTISGQPFDFKVTYRNESENEYRNLILALAYPSNMQFKNAEPEADVNDTDWNIPVLKPGEEKEIEITGIVLGVAGSFLNFNAQINAVFAGRTYTITDESSALSIAPSPLSLQILLNGKGDYIAGLDEPLVYTIVYKNESATSLSNLALTAKLVGDLLDFSTAETSGSLNSITNTFTWNAGNTKELARVDGGAGGSVTINIRSKKEFPITRIGDKNYTLLAQANAESATVLPENAGEKTVAIAALETKVKGLLTIQSKGYFRDAASGVLNIGPYPPRVNQATQYTMHWIIKNYSTNTTGVKARAFLQSGAKLVKVVAHGGESAPNYNSSTGELTWDLGTIPATKGVATAPLEAVFQIEHTPAVNQVGQRPVLMGETKIEGTDDFTGIALSGASPAITTELPDDTSTTSSGGEVQP